MDLRLTDRVAFVTGGTRGLGRAICLALATEGARVAINYRTNAEEAHRLVQLLQSETPGLAILCQGDVSSERDVERMFDHIEGHWGCVEILINNAATCPTCAVTDLTLEQWNQTLHSNLTGTFLACRRLAQRLIARSRPGRIVNISSTAAFLGSTTGHAPYDASKGGIVSLTTSLARELAPHRIAVNAVAPGMIRTEMTADTLRANEAKYLARIPLQRIADPGEIADVVVFLASDRASYLTGTTVNVSGGMLMR